MVSNPKLEWGETAPGRMWRTLNGEFLIMAIPLPEIAGRGLHTGFRVMYQARWITEVSRGEITAKEAYRNAGILLGEAHSLWYADGGYNSAEGMCQRKAWSLARPGAFHVPQNHPAAALSHFYWPDQGAGSSGGRGALAIVWKGDRLVAQVLGMGRKDDETTEVGEFVEIDLTSLGVTADPRSTPTLTEHLEQCGGCGAKAGSPHFPRCDHARCLVTGEQRALCEIFGDAPTAGMLTVATGGSKEEFEEYFRNDVDHDCGQDIFRG